MNLGTTELSDERLSEIYEEAKWQYCRPGVLQSSQHLLKEAGTHERYSNFDLMTCSPYACQQVTTLLGETIRDIVQARPAEFLAFIDKDKVGGGTVGAIRFAAAISIHTGIPNISVRLGKEYPPDRVSVPVRSPQSSSGALEGARGIMVTDHCTTGEEIARGIEALESNGGEVTDVVAYAARQREMAAAGYLAKLRTKGIDFHSIHDLDLIDQEMYPLSTACEHE